LLNIKFYVVAVEQDLGQSPVRFILLQLAFLLHLGLFFFFPCCGCIIVTLVANLEKIDVPCPSPKDYWVLNSNARTHEDVNYFQSSGKIDCCCV